MLKIQLACLATATWACATPAQALKEPIRPPQQEAIAQNLKCEPTDVSKDRIVAADLPRTVIVNLILTAGKAITFKVTYIEENGEKSNPSDITKPWSLVSMPSGNDHHWWAIGIRQPNLLMHGRLFKQSAARTGEKRWLYYEEQFEAGLKTSDFQVACVEQ